MGKFQCYRWGCATLLAVGVVCESYAGDRVYVDFQAGIAGEVPTPQNWNAIGSAELGSGDPVPLVNEAGLATGIRFDYVRPEFGSYSGSNSPLYSFVQPTGIDLTPMDHTLGLGSFDLGRTLEFIGLNPGQGYKVWALTDTPSTSFRDPMRFAVVGARGWTELAPPENALLAINDEHGSTARSFDSYAKTFTAALDGRLAFQAVGGELIDFYGFVLEPIEGGSVTLEPVVDGQAEWNGSGYDVMTADTVIGVQVSSFLDVDRRMLMEFDLAAVPIGAKVTSASVAFDVSSWTGSVNHPTTFELLAYAGDGALTAVDPLLGVSLGQSVSIDSVGPGDPLVFELDAHALNTLLEAGATHLGLAGRAGPEGYQVNVHSIETSFGEPPTLSLSYGFESTVPFGDLNADGVVDADDLVIVNANFGMQVAPGALAMGDVSGDGHIGVADMDIVLSGWTQPAAGIAHVPEPAVVSLFLPPLLARRRRSA